MGVLRTIVGRFRETMMAALGRTVRMLACAGLLSGLAGMDARAQTKPDPAADPSKWYVVTGDIVGDQVAALADPGKPLGRLKGFVLSSADGRALYAIVDVGGFLGIDGTSVVVPYDRLAFSGQWDHPRLDIAPGLIAAAPRVTDTTIEALLRDPNWRKSVADFYATRAKPAAAPVATAAPSPRTPRRRARLSPAGGIRRSRRRAGARSSRQAAPPATALGSPGAPARP